MESLKLAGRGGPALLLFVFVFWERECEESVFGPSGEGTKYGQLVGSNRCFGIGPLIPLPVRGSDITPRAWG